MKKILVIGSCGAGKSTLALKLGEILKIEVFHLDRLYWKPNWRTSSKSEFWEQQLNIFQKDSWIIDGNYGGTIPQRMPYADTIIFLDVSKWLCIFRACKRWIQFRNQSRPDMGVGCKEKIDLDFLKFIYNYPKRNRPIVIRELNNLRANQQLFHLKSSKSVERFLQELRQNVIRQST